MAGDTAKLLPGTDHRLDWLTCLGRAGDTRNLTVKVPAGREDRLRALLRPLSRFELNRNEGFGCGSADGEFWDVEYRLRGAAAAPDAPLAATVQKFEAAFAAEFADADYALSVGRGFSPQLDPSTATATAKAKAAAAAAMVEPDVGADVLSANAVCMVVIDDGIGVAHDRFTGRKGSRIVRFLDMNGRAGTAPPLGGSLISGTGVAWRAEDIDRLRAACAGDEDRIYRAMGMDLDDAGRKSSLCYRVSHGSHVADLAAGYPRDDAAAAKRPIIAIQLPRSIVLDTSGSGMVAMLSRALHWLRREIEGFRRFPKRLALNLSFGVYAGPHDGSDLVVRRLEAFREWFANSATGRSCEVFLPAGNSFQNRGVAMFGPCMPAEVEWVVLPDDRTASFAEVWLPKGAKPSGLSFRLVSPDGRTCRSLAGRRSDLVSNGISVACIYHSWRQGREVISFALRPTETLGAAPTSPSGRWKITVENPNGIEFALRVQRDDPQPGSRRKGRQSYLADPTYRTTVMPGGGALNDVTANRPVTRAGTLNVFATGHMLTSVAGYVGSKRQQGQLRSQELAARYSSAGPADGKARRKGPDLAHETEAGTAHFGVLGAGSRSGSAVLLSGTSAAAPQAARAWADGTAYQRPRGLDAQRLGKGLGDLDGAGRPPRRV